jgi:hypothetical protein
MILGTPAYMSPEIVDARPIDGRSDIYSLGVVAYECLTGRVPFEGTPIAQIAGHGFERVKRPSEIGASLDPRIEELVMRMLEKNADDRPQAAGTLLREVDRLLLELKGRPPRRMGAVLIGLGIALAIGVLIASIDFPPNQDVADAATEIAPVVDAGFDFGSGSVRATPSIEGWEDPDAVLLVLRDLTPVLLECYGLLEGAQEVTVRFDAMQTGTDVTVEPPEAARVRECFAFRRGQRIEWPGRGRASLVLAPR